MKTALSEEPGTSAVVAFSLEFRESGWVAEAIGVELPVPITLCTLPISAVGLEVELGCPTRLLERRPLSARLLLQPSAYFTGRLRMLVMKESHSREGVGLLPCLRAGVSS